MPVILENGSEQIQTWLDPNRSEWSKELQSLLKPYKGELECYPVSKDVGKVGNNSPTFIIPVASSENKNNIANFFSSAKGSAKGQIEEKALKLEEAEVIDNQNHVDFGKDEERITVNPSRSEDNAPMPIPKAENRFAGLKREHKLEEGNRTSEPAIKVAKLESSDNKAEAERYLSKAHRTLRSRQMKSATSNDSVLKRSPAKANDGSQKITQFFG